MQLIYRGEIIERNASVIPAYRKPAALNWRYQVPGEVYGEAPTPRRIAKTPQAINWRWQPAQ